MSCSFGVSPTPFTRRSSRSRKLLAKRVADPGLLDGVAVELCDVLGHALARRVVPGAVADPVSRVDRAGTLRAEIGVPGRGPRPAAVASAWQWASAPARP